MSLWKELRQLYIKLDAECFSKIRKWILEKRKLNWYFLFWLVWWIKKVIGFGYFCLWRIHFCLFGFLFLSSHSLKVLDKGCNSWKWVFSSICDKCIRDGIFFFFYHFEWDENVQILYWVFSVWYRGWFDIEHYEKGFRENCEMCDCSELEIYENVNELWIRCDSKHKYVRAIIYVDVYFVVECFHLKWVNDLKSP